MAGAAALLLCAGCVKQEDVLEKTPAPSDEAISFTQTVTRAPVSSLGEGDAFAVWAQESKEGNSSMILSQERVYNETGVWRYDHTRYWKQGASYAFQAVYPHDTPNVTVTKFPGDDTPHLMIAEFDGSRGIDLMTTGVQEMTYTGNPAPVHFTFSHLMCRLEFVGRSTVTGTTVDVKDVKLFGMSRTADYDGFTRKWIPGETETTLTHPFASAAGPFILTSAGTTVMTDILLFPQLVENDFFIEATIEGINGGLTHTLALLDAGLVQWQPGHSYRYTISLTSNEDILFETPQVLPWSTGSAGIIPVE